jgi:hypothetical protein
MLRFTARRSSREREAYHHDCGSKNMAMPADHPCYNPAGFWGNNCRLLHLFARVHHGGKAPNLLTVFTGSVLIMSEDSYQHLVVVGLLKIMLLAA